MPHRNFNKTTEITMEDGNLVRKLKNHPYYNLSTDIDDWRSGGGVLYAVHFVQK